MLAIDTETTGLDFRHGAKPFLVTVMRDGADAPEFVEWDVDPYTREPQIPDVDREWLSELLGECRESDGVVFQNAKFDLAALTTILPPIETEWPWERTEETLYLAHLLSSNQRKSLDALALTYLGIDLTPLEVALDKAVQEARRYVRRKAFVEKHGTWRIAERGLPEMPSAKDKVGKFDLWLPRTVARYEEFDSDHPWWTVCSDYANPDSATTLALWHEMSRMAKDRGLWNLYQERRKLTEIVYQMEQRGIAVSQTRLQELQEKYSAESEQLGERCVAVAKSLDYDLTLPKNGNNKSLLEFCFGREEFDEDGEKTGHAEWLNLPAVGYTDTGNPSLDKDAMEAYSVLLPEKSKQGVFVRSLAAKRARDTAITYMEGYERFGIPLDGDPDWFILFPRLNATKTNTLRFGSESPNEQNISKREGFNLRYAFGPASGREWWPMDAQNIELRLPAYLSGEPELIALFERPDDPPYYGSFHLLNFHTVYPDIWDRELRGVGPEKVGKHCKEKYKSTWYQHCKNGGFAKQYGGQRAKVDATFHRPGAFSLIEERFNKLTALNNATLAFANRYGYVETIPDRTVDPKRGYPLVCPRSDRGDVEPTKPLNYKIQGSAMWWTCKAMTRVSAFFAYLNAGGIFAGKAWPGGYYLAMQVHDELVSDMPSGRGRGKNPWSYNLPIAREVKRLMELGGDDYGIPTPVGCEYCERDWSTGKAINL